MIPPAHLRHFVAALLIACGAGRAAEAQDDGPALRPAAASPADTSLPATPALEVKPGAHGVVVLTDGRVFSGHLSETGGGYRLAFRGSSFVIPFEEVQVTGSSLLDAYGKLQRSITNPTAIDHIKLAEWCRHNGLWQQARQEVLLALELEPLREDARALLREIQQKIDPTSAQAILNRGGPDPAAAARAERALQGLSRETVQDFIRQVQPLLQNKCGNANCHGRASNSAFRLVGSRSMSRHHRLSSDENLQTVLGLISADDPVSSPLLASLADATEQHKTLFRGSVGAGQYQLLVDWIKRAAAEKHTPASAGPLPVAASPLLIQPAGAEVPPPASSAPASSDRAPSGPSLPTELSGPVKELLDRAQPVPQLSNAAVREILQQKAPDAFDPEEFNRLVHGIEANR